MCFGNRVLHSGILELPPNEYSWSHWLPYCKLKPNVWQNCNSSKWIIAKNQALNKKQLTNDKNPQSYFASFCILISNKTVTAERELSLIVYEGFGE